MNSSRTSILNKFIAALAIVCTAFAGGCTDDLRLSAPAADIQNSVSLGFSIEGPAITRAVAALPHETAIRDVYLLFFDDSPTDGDALMLGYVKASVDDADSGTLRFPIPSFLQKNQDYRILGLANPDGFTPTGFDNYMQYLESILPSSTESTLTKRDIEATLLLASESSLVYDPDNEDFLIPLTGTASGEGSSLFSVLTVDGSYRMSRPLVFRRSMARIDVINGAESEFQLVQCAVCNYRDKSLPFSPTEPTGEINDIGSMGNPVASLYTFPNSSATVESGDTSSTGIIVKGYYIEGDTPDSEASYYRVNIGSQDNSQMILPNHLYRLRIKSVKGRGAATPEEAYGSGESLIELAADSEWDEPGKWYDMDEAGNYIAVSQLRIDFPGTGYAADRNMVFASNNVDWHIEIESGSDWLSVSKETNCFYLTPSSDNTSEAARTAVVRVAGTVAGSATPLSVTMTASQSPAGGTVEDWELPPLALVPVDAKYDATTGKLIADHVKVSHVKNVDGTWNNTIEIDGFEPTCFNSFIDIPCRLHIDPEIGDAATVKISNDLLWPLEGCISQSGASNLKYTWDSFPKSSAFSVSNPIPQQPVPQSNSLSDGASVVLSAGAMAPDDPEIVRNITLSSNNGLQQVSYTLRIAPRDIVVDDVILQMPDKSYIMVCDRNIQSVFTNKYFGWDSNGYKKGQAYHYGNYKWMKIPFKFSSNTQTIAWEDQHEDEQLSGTTLSIFLSSDAHIQQAITNWKSKYISPIDRLSPFYNSTSILEWNTPSYNQMDWIISNISVSKMRMFIVSDVQLANDVPVCCYLPYYMKNTSLVPTNTNASSMYEYVLSQQESTGFHSIRLVIDTDRIGYTLITNLSSSSGNGIIRSVRTLSSDELEMYKTNYLGYGSEPSPLRPCTPDTYPWKSPYE